jgi:hypothetical protein
MKREGFFKLQHFLQGIFPNVDSRWTDPIVFLRTRGIYFVQEFCKNSYFKADLVCSVVEFYFVSCTNLCN